MCSLRKFLMTLAAAEGSSKLQAIAVGPLRWAVNSSLLASSDLRSALANDVVLDDLVLDAGLAETSAQIGDQLDVHATKIDEDSRVARVEAFADRDDLSRFVFVV